RGPQAKSAGDDFLPDPSGEGGDISPDHDGDSDAAVTGMGDAFGDEGHPPENDEDAQEGAGGADDGSDGEQVAVVANPLKEFHLFWPSFGRVGTGALRGAAKGTGT